MAASPSPLPATLPDPSCLTLEDVEQQGGILKMTVAASADEAICPGCGTRSHRVHSRYCRTLRDLPCHGQIVRICLRTHRFYCGARECRCRIFTQRLPVVASPHARQTRRHHSALLAIGYALGGEPGSRLATCLGIQSSADTILRIIGRTSPAEPPDDVKVLGVDDWAWRRGHRYGTILVDLERRQPIDLLPDRETETLAAWLRAHPTVRVITRDRAGAYAEGARQGAPDAMQVADRFHLFCNLTQALQRVVERLASTLRQIQLPEPSVSPGGSPYKIGPDEQKLAPIKKGESETPVKLNRHEQQRWEHREKRKALFESVRAEYQRGLTKRAIARKLGITRTTVRRFLRAAEFPERAPRQHRSQLDSFREYLEKRWAEGCHNASQLCRELHQRGYTGQRSRVKEYVRPWRAKALPAHSKPRRTLPNVRLVAFWLTKPPTQRNSEEQRWVQAVTTAHPQLATAEHLAQQFRQLFKDRNSNALNTWLKTSLESQIPELKPFVAGLQRDYEAVVAAVEQSWSNGQVEGQVHRLKLLKRQMYGRGGFLLLRRRVLPFIYQRSERSP
jgi:transposase